MKRTYPVILATAVFLFPLLSFQKSLEACSRTSPVIVRQTCGMAEYIVRAKAVRYSLPPRGTGWTTGVPDSRVLFSIQEVLKGDSLPSTIELNGYLTDKDDFNDHPVPYTFVRPGGRKGSCFANSYKRGAEFLLFLRRSRGMRTPGNRTTFTTDIDALAPVNEQLHSPRDPWVYYIKGLLEGTRDTPGSEKVTR